ncbi:MAG TPA: trypsin-like peptidase domain-containing protein [Vicinamibacterales bacterium]|nr:trypsin-like peptidase domain-containing protein [Vicinamibacterales bacterium]
MTKRTSIFTAVLIAVASLAAGLVLASRLDLTPASSAQPMAVPEANSEPINGAIDATTFRRIAQAVSPAVVSIQTRAAARRRETNDFFDQNPFFGIPRGPQGRAPQQPREGSGSGFIIDAANGYILTNNHVVEDADQINVGFYGDHRFGETVTAKVIGRDPLSDSALLQLNERPSRELMQVKFGDSNQMAPGDWVVAIGNPFQLRHTVTVGVVSATGRDEFQTVDRRSQEMIQTDAAINPGNSGGPLLNVRGEVIGINTAIFTNETQSNLGIGFAVPINTVRDLLPQLRTGRVIRGQLGVTVDSIPFTAAEVRDLGLPNGGGALISSVGEGSAAAKGGMQVNDIVIEFNGQPVRSSSELIAMVVAARPGTTVPVKVVRSRQQRTLNITIDELDLLAQEERSRQARESTESGIGLTLNPLTPQLQRRLEVPAGRGGAVVTDVVPGSIAQRSLFAEGDVILEINGSPIRTTDEALRAFDAVPPGSTALVTVWRQGSEQGLRVRKR